MVERIESNASVLDTKYARRLLGNLTPTFSFFNLAKTIRFTFAKLKIEIKNNKSIKRNRNHLRTLREERSAISLGGDLCMARPLDLVFKE